MKKIMNSLNEEKNEIFAPTKNGEFFLFDFNLLAIDTSNSHERIETMDRYH